MFGDIFGDKYGTMQSRCQQSTEEWACEVMKGGNDVTPARKNIHLWAIHIYVGP